MPRKNMNFHKHVQSALNTGTYHTSQNDWVYNFINVPTFFSFMVPGGLMVPKMYCITWNCFYKKVVNQ